MNLREFLWSISPYHRIKEWWRLRLFREYQRGWIDSSKDPDAKFTIPTAYTNVIGPGVLLMQMPDDHQFPPWWVRAFARVGIDVNRDPCQCFYCRDGYHG